MSDFRSRYPTLYTEDFKKEVQSTATTVFEDSFSKEVWSSTYKDHKDDTIDDTIYRIAASAAGAEESEKLAREWTFKFYELLSNFKATSGGRIYSNAGTEWKGTTLMNCFVAPRAKRDIDSLDNIITNLRNQAFTLKSEGGWGENFSYIRPRGSFIHGIGVETPGAIKYMEMFDKSSEIITSGSGQKSANKKAKGKIRKGAMMGVLDVWHPDIIEFITAKQTPGRLTKFNMSVNCTDEFMDKIFEVKKCEEELEESKRIMTETKDDTEAKYHAEMLPFMEDAIKQADEWQLRFPDTTHSKYKKEWTGNLKEWEDAGHPTNVLNTVSVRWLWNLIMESTYARAEPGILFMDRANHFGPLSYAETIGATNPCGEQTLAPGGVCNLGSLNLTQFINRTRTGFNYDKLKTFTRYLVRFLDNINNISETPLLEYTNSMKDKRRIGCGILGWGSALFMMKVPFGSELSAKLRDQTMKTIAREAYMASIDLAEEKGMFAICNPKKHSEGPFVQGLKLPDEYMIKLRSVGIRNSSLLSVQPTGNTSILANIVSGGLEPVFMPEYVRTVIVNTMPEHIAEVTPKWYEGEFHTTKMFKKAKEGDEEILKGVDENGVVYKIDKNRGLTKEVLCEDYGVRHLKLKGEWDANADWAVTTTNLTVDQHVEDLQGFARWVDSAMSKTINVPNDYPFEKFTNIYLDTYSSGYVKGITTYRAGTMTTVLSAKNETEEDNEEIILDDVKLPASSPAVMKTIKAEGKKFYLTIVYHEDNHNRPFALFVKSNHSESSTLTHDATEQLFKLAKKKKIPKKHREDVMAKCVSDNNANKVARVISLLLRHGVLIKNIVASLDKVENAFAGSFVFHVKKYLGSYIKDGEKVEDEKCLECGSESVVFTEGCKKCISCGSSKCG